MGSRRGRLVASLAHGALCLCACSTESVETAVVEIGLGAEIPPEVTSISVFVIDLDRERVVAGATLAASRTTVLLGVPAEVPLEFRSVARTSRPGVAMLGTMPAYFGSVVRTIPLGRERQRVGITVHRAGVLTLAVEPPLARDAEGLELPSAVRIAIEPERAGDRALEVEVPLPEVSPSPPLGGVPPPLEIALVLRSGRMTARVLPESGEQESLLAIAGGEGIFVAPEQESVAPIRLVPAVPPPGPGVAVAIEVGLVPFAATSTAGVIETLPQGPTDLQLRLTAVDTLGGSVQLPEAALSWSISSTPAGALVGPGRATSGTARGLPSVIAGFRASGLGRARVSVDTAATPAPAPAPARPRSRLRGETHVNIEPIGLEPGPAEEMIVRLRDESPEALIAGTELAIELIDGSGLYASGFSGKIDLTRSDPWVFVPAGATAQLAPAQRGRFVRRVVRASGPRGLPLAIRATVTSTAPPLVLTSTLTLAPIVR